MQWFKSYASFSELTQTVVEISTQYSIYEQFCKQQFSFTFTFIFQQFLTLFIDGTVVKMNLP
jgi:hypothetical protein